MSAPSTATKRTKRCLGLCVRPALGTALAGFALAVPAHHGWSGYDADKPLHLTGTIEKSGYEHPHGYLHLTTEGRTWRVVLAPPYRMQNRGLPREELAPGNRVSVFGYPHRSDPDEMRAERITVGDKSIELR